ncbi:MAG: nicotinamide riboside transporter PnuC [Bacteroidota bacterium]|nr:nicotinamide riboside transporter PnuC [Bacteroidota bacterium]
MFSDFYAWINENSWVLTELLGVITALVYLYFSVKQKIWLWPFGILTSALYILIFFNSRLYADMGLQVYYLLISFYGWYYWYSKAQKQNQEKLPVSRINSNQIVRLALFTFALYWIIVLALKNVPSWLDIPASDLLYWDAFTTAASIIATWMLARKILEHWIVWILVDSISLGLYIYKGLFVTSFLFFIYTLIAIYGYFEWKKELT